MAGPQMIADRWNRALNRLYARLARRHARAQSFALQPEPRTIGSIARGRQLIAGRLQFAGYLVETTVGGLWDVPAPDAAFDAERHGFTWLDDLAAVGDAQARDLAQRWLWDWIARFGAGQGPGWAPDLTGRRLIRWINHAIFLLRGRGSAEREAFFRALARQSWFLSRRWQAAAPGVPQFEALIGLIHAGLSLEGEETLADPAVRALARKCDSQIDGEGAIPTRNPEELLEIFMLLTWAAAALHEAGRGVPLAHLRAIERITPTLRALRHADGGLARFHGGGRGLEGRLDHALAASHVKPGPIAGLAMGYARLSARRTSVIVDAAAPPKGVASVNAHASTLAFELTTGRRPLIVNCGSGACFGSLWRRAGRATPSHSSLGLRGHSSARLAADRSGTGAAYLVAGPEHVPVALSDSPEAMTFEGAHDGYVPAFGLTHARRLDLGFDGRILRGEDMLLAIEETHKDRFDRALLSAGPGGIAFDIRLHLHPDVVAARDPGGASVSLTLKSGEVWVFRCEGGPILSLDTGVYLDSSRHAPRVARQIVLSANATGHATRLRWTLSKARETAVAVRDLERDEPDFDS